MNSEINIAWQELYADLSTTIIAWQLGLIVFGVRFLVQAFVLYPCMKKLKEMDLYPFFLFIDIWMFFYYLIFARSLIKKPKPAWNG